MGIPRQELIDAVEKILSGDHSDEVTDGLFEFIDKHVPCPYSNISHTIFYSEGLTTGQMVDEMLNYKPVRL